MGKPRAQNWERTEQDVLKSTDNGDKEGQWRVFFVEVVGVQDEVTTGNPQLLLTSFSRL